MTRFGLAAVLVVACGGSSKSAVEPTTPGGGGTGDVANPIPQTKGADCPIVAERFATVAQAEHPDRQDAARELVRTRCTDDAWADDARSCFAAVETDDELQGCLKLLAEPQRKKLHQAERDLPAKGGAMSAPAPGSHEDTAPEGGRRGAKRNSSDPCEGGE